MTRKPTSLSAQILKIVETGHLMTAPQILDALSRAGQNYNKTSLYRALNKLVFDNKMCKHSLGGNQIHYELRSHHHDHLVCTVCHKPDSVNCVLSKVDSIKGYQIEHHHLTIFGVCPNCQQKQKTQSQKR